MSVKAKKKECSFGIYDPITFPTLHSIPSMYRAANKLEEQH